MDCLYAKCIPYITECVMGELERMGEKYRMALKMVKDPRIEKLTCLHKGIYADDCLVQRVTQVYNPQKKKIEGFEWWLHREMIF